MLTEASFCRNAGTVRQMLESKRSVGVSTTTTFQASLSTGEKLPTDFINTLLKSFIASC